MKSDAAMGENTPSATATKENIIATAPRKTPRFLVNTSCEGSESGISLIFPLLPCAVSAPTAHTTARPIPVIISLPAYM